jgi:ATP-dependent DNA ligase
VFKLYAPLEHNLDLVFSYMFVSVTQGWLKLKKDYLDSKIGDTLDLVPIGVYYGFGKRKSIMKHSP